MSARFDAFKRTAACALAVLGLTNAASSAPPDKSGVKPGAISLPSGPGSIEGLGESFEAQLNTGTSSYGVGFALPPGRAGLQPNLRLSYNSGQGNGLAGLGWNLDLPMIKRQTDKGFPAYNAQDTFVFQGEELVPLNNEERDWRCENESGFQRFRQIDTDGDLAADAWEMTERNGTRHIFGQYHGQGGRWSRVAHPNLPPSPELRFHHTYCWVLDTTIDLHGNRIEYEYSQGPGVLYPGRITYAHSGAISHEVLFGFAARADVFDDYRPGFSAKWDKRLNSVEARSNGMRVRLYKLDYADELTPSERAEMGMGLPDISLLCRVKQLGRDGNAVNYLPPLLFGYSQLALGAAVAGTIAEQGGGAPTLDLADEHGDTQLADVNGDGLPDLFSTLPQGGINVQQVSLNLGEEDVGGGAFTFFAPPLLVANPSQPLLSQPNTTLTDMDGDGLVDLVQIVPDFPGIRLDTYRNRARLDEVADEDPAKLGFEPFNAVQEHVSDAPFFLSFSDPGTRQVDLNFDKVSDFLNIAPGFPTPIIQASYRDREGLWRHVFDWGDHAPPDMPNSLSFTEGENSNPAVHLADLNGDRLQDIVLLELSGGGVGAQLSLRYWPMRGLGRWAESRVIQPAAGDNLQVDAIDLRDVYLEDVTGDGLTDLLIMNGSGSESVLTLRVNIAGQRWAAPVVLGGLPAYDPRAESQPTIFRFADINGNGSRDLVFRNQGIGGGWFYVELLPQGRPNQLVRINNGLGKNTFITYGASTREMQRARQAGAPWTTKAAFPVDVVKRIRTTCGLDLNGDGKLDQMVSDLQYRDAFYDGFEREFRGFAFAQRLDYGDDFIYDTNTGLMLQSGNATPSGPTLVTRYRFLTGAADRRDNDGGDGTKDEVTAQGGREEEVLKGRQIVEEKVDAAVALGAAGANFDANCRSAALAPDFAGQSRITPDDYVYTRARQNWAIRRLYRPAEAIKVQNDNDADGILSEPQDAILSPAGRLGAVRPGNGRSVSFAFVSLLETDVLEANGVLVTKLGYPARAGYLTRKSFDYDDYGNETLEMDFGIVGGGFDDERKTAISYAHGGNALSLWVIDKPDVISVTDENDVFVAKKVHFYDGAAYIGVQGQIQSRALLARTQEFKDPASPITATRTAYDAFGNPIGMRDPVGNQRHIGYDPVFQIYPVSEAIAVGGGHPDLTVSATYDTGFGVVTQSTDFNGNVTTYGYDTFARLVNIVRPGDSPASPTLAFEYQPADPARGRLYNYDAAGNLTLGGGLLNRVASRVVSRLREQAGGGQFITAAFSDGCGKKLGTVEEGTAAGAWIVKSSASYNLRGGPQSEWLPFQIASGGVPQFSDFWTGNGRPPATDGVNPAIVSTDRFHDSLGREIASLDPPETWGGDRKTAKVQYLPFEQRHFDEEDTDNASIHAATPMVHLLDGLGRMIAVEEVVKTTDAGNLGPLASWRTHYAYDLNDQLRQITDSQNNVKTMVFDGLKRMTAMNDPDRGPMTFVYDDASNLIETIDAKGQRILYTYDGANRIKTEDYLDDAGFAPDVLYTYDTAAAIPLGDGSTGSGLNVKGQLASVRDLSGETHFSYDARARVTWEVKRIPDRLTGQLVSYRTRFAYDSADRLATLTYPDGDQLSHGYNARNLLTQLSGDAAGNLIGAIAYRPSGQLGSISYGNATATAYIYDPRLRLRAINTQHTTLNAQLVSFSYTFDGASNITQIEDQRDLSAQPQAAERFNTQSFSYDSLYRLTRVDYPGYQGAAAKFVQYRYDRIGNMLQQTSDIAQEENGLPVANLGVMESGGPAGRSGRVGRNPGDPPGPHALTSVGGTRSYDYDANGNMKAIDGMQCVWDFKDRLIAVENDQMRASYTYDYTDRRITKTVTPKTPNSQSSTSTHYINKYFEVRDHDAPVKYVWNGDTRVARVTGSLASGPRTQALRLRAGWNLAALRVGGFLPALDPAQNTALGASAYWSASASGNQLVKIDAAVNVPAGVPAWIFAKQDTTVFLTGASAAGSLPDLTGAGQFLANTLVEPLDLAALLPSNALLMSFDAAAQTWRSRYPGTLAPFSNAGLTLPPGQSLWIRDGTPGALPSPTATLSIRYYHQDHLGSSSVVTDQSGALVEETANYPFGHPRHSHKPGPVLPEPYGFTQKERDKESGLHYFEARYLASQIARFLRVDPLAVRRPLLHIKTPQRLHAYAYCRNMPLSLIDPTGCVDKEVSSENTEAFCGNLDSAYGVTNTSLDVAGGLGKIAGSLGKAAGPLSSSLMLHKGATNFACYSPRKALIETAGMVIGNATTGLLSASCAGVIQSGALSGAIYGGALGATGGLGVGAAPGALIGGAIGGGGAAIACIGGSIFAGDLVQNVSKMALDYMLPQENGVSLPNTQLPSATVSSPSWESLIPSPSPNACTVKPEIPTFQNMPLP